MFEIGFGGRKWRTDDLTLDETCLLEEELGESWLRINPAVSGRANRAVLVRFLCREMDEETARAKVGALSLREAVEGVSVAKDDLPDMYEDGLPKAEADPSMTGSSGPPDDTDGPLA